MAFMTILEWHVKLIGSSVVFPIGHVVIVLGLIGMGKHGEAKDQGLSLQMTERGASYGCAQVMVSSSL